MRYTEKIEDDILGKAIIIIITLCSLSFFLVKGIGKGNRILELIGVGMIILSLLLYLIYFKKSKFFSTSYSSSIISFMLLGVLISTFACSFYYGQSIGITLYQQRHTYFLLFYFLLPFIMPNPDWIKNLIYYLGVIGAGIYILQYFAYPMRITEAKMFVDRGTLRINLPGISFMHLAYFLCIDRFFMTSEKKYAIGILILLATAVLSAFRSVVAVYIGLAGIYLLLNNHVKNKFLILITSVVIAIAGFFVFQDIILAMQSSAERETSLGSDYVRVRAGNYFLGEMAKSKVIAITGNGQPSERSEYGQWFAGIAIRYGYYLSDVGIIGTYYKFGILFAFTALFAMVRITIMKLPKELNFIRLFMIMQLLVILLSSFTFEGYEGAIILGLILYLIDWYKNDEMNNKLNQIIEN